MEPQASLQTTSYDMCRQILTGCTGLIQCLDLTCSLGPSAAGVYCIMVRTEVIRRDLGFAQLGKWGQATGIKREPAA